MIGGMKELMNFRHFKDKLNNILCILNDKKLAISMEGIAVSILVTKPTRIPSTIMKRLGLEATIEIPTPSTLFYVPEFHGHLHL